MALADDLLSRIPASHVVDDDAEWDDGGVTIETYAFAPYYVRAHISSQQCLRRLRGDVVATEWLRNLAFEGKLPQTFVVPIEKQNLPDRSAFAFVVDMLCRTRVEKAEWAALAMYLLQKAISDGERLNPETRAQLVAELRKLLRETPLTWELEYPVRTSLALLGE